MIVAVSMVKDEQDIIATVVSHLIEEGVDHIIVADNLSTDYTRGILECFSSDEVTVVDDNEPGYYQDRKMTNLAHQAGAMGADWVIPFDADEIWYSPDETLGGALAGTAAGVLVASTYHHIPHAADPVELDPVLRMQHRLPEPKRLSKVAFRYNSDVRLHMGNHDVDNVGGVREQGLEIREFQYRTWPQFCRKLRNGAAAYAATDLHEMYGTHWRRADGMTEDDLRAEWDALCATPDLVYDPAPVNSRLPRIAA